MGGELEGSLGRGKQEGEGGCACHLEEHGEAQIETGSRDERLGGRLQQERRGRRDAAHEREARRAAVLGARNAARALRVAENAHHLGMGVGWAGVVAGGGGCR